jgi:hypothetical protein
MGKKEPDESFSILDVEAFVPWLAFASPIDRSTGDWSAEMASASLTFIRNMLVMRALKYTETSVNIDESWEDNIQKAIEVDENVRESVRKYMNDLCANKIEFEHALKRIFSQNELLRQQTDSPEIIPILRRIFEILTLGPVTASSWFVREIDLFKVLLLEIIWTRLMNSLLCSPVSPKYESSRQEYMASSDRIPAWK